MPSESYEEISNSIAESYEENTWSNPDLVQWEVESNESNNNENNNETENDREPSEFKDRAYLKDLIELSEKIRGKIKPAIEEIQIMIQAIEESINLIKIPIEIIPTLICKIADMTPRRIELLPDSHEDSAIGMNIYGKFGVYMIIYPEPYEIYTENTGTGRSVHKIKIVLHIIITGSECSLDEIWNSIFKTGGMGVKIDEEYILEIDKLIPYEHTTAYEYRNYIFCMLSKEIIEILKRYIELYTKHIKNKYSRYIPELSKLKKSVRKITV